MTAPLHSAAERQIQAADPAQSTWLLANAGSGKTRVLTDRVARLLLDGTDPTRILCLTYTKAAASEMQNRLFNTLGKWAMLPDADLRTALTGLGVARRIQHDTLAEARRLFARAIETPGGLRIQTIHSFCSSLLRRFPLEARVSPAFTELDDRAGNLMMQDIVSDMAETIAPDVVRRLVGRLRIGDFDTLTKTIATLRRGFQRGLSRADWLARFDLPPDFTTESLLAEVFLGDEADLIAAILPHLQAGGAKDISAASELAGRPWNAPGLPELEALESVLLHGKSAMVAGPFTAKGAAFPNKETRKKIAPWQDRLDRLGLRVEAARTRRLALETAENTIALHDFADVFLAEYAARKAARAILDFDDQIARAVDLLTDPQVAQWVLFRLDGGIDHILVDEAQDTSPLQWRVIELLAREFTTGEGARDLARTLFVVGDKKQSIYSFQGADLQAFDQMQALFASRFSAIGQRLYPLELEFSFRSSPAILRVVDHVFAPYLDQGLGGLCQHHAFRDAMPGSVEVWPPLLSAKRDDSNDAWWRPVDLIDEEHSAVRLADRIAAHIRQMLQDRVSIPDGNGFRPVHEGDFLILVRGRSTLFAQIIRACKQAGLPMAGADRLRLGGELAVKDLAAVLSFLATPKDDLSLAAALRSPLFGWSEQALFRLAHARPGDLWQALRDAGEHAETVSILRDLRDQADFLRPYDLIERILTRHDGRRRLLARLGPEAEDGIDELLAQAMAYETNDVPSLTGFLGWLQTDDVTVKRQLDGGGRFIRVMTVHGAKGLEAPVVILPDTANGQGRERDNTVAADDGAHLWKGNKENRHPKVNAAQAAVAGREREEELRLLYVALTRAQSRLIVCAAGAAESETCWHRLVTNGMVAAGAEQTADGNLFYQFGTFPTIETAQDATAPQDATVALPDWAQRPAPDAPRPPLPLSPSTLPGAKVMPGEVDGDLADSLIRGSALHVLLEHLPRLPRDRWDDAAAALLAETPQAQEIAAEARAVLDAPHLAYLFAPGSLAEVPITADFGGERLYGVIDRLIVGPDSVLAVDFKSNRVTPDSPSQMPEGIRAQLAAYRVALAQIYPGHRIEAAVLWTRTRQLMLLD